MPSLFAIFFGVLADRTCAPHDSEDNVCLLALNSSRSRLEANVTAAVSGDLHNMTDLSLTGGNSQSGLGATLGTLVSDYRVRSARSSTNQSGGGAVVQSSGTARSANANDGEVTSSGEATSGNDGDTAGGETSTTETHASPVTLEPRLSPQFQERMKASSGSAAEKNLNASKGLYAKQSHPMHSKEEFIPAPRYPPKDGDMQSAAKGTWHNPLADELAKEKRISASVNSGELTTSLTSSASELQTVLQSMYQLGRLIKRMPDDKLESRHETPAPTPPPYAFSRHFEPFGKGTSTV
jgi:hypothetical protein